MIVVLIGKEVEKTAFHFSRAIHEGFYLKISYYERKHVPHNTKEWLESSVFSLLKSVGICR